MKALLTDEITIEKIGITEKQIESFMTKKERLQAMALLALLKVHLEAGIDPKSLELVDKTVYSSDPPGVVSYLSFKIK